MNAKSELCTEAWLLKGINSLPGALKLQDGRLSYTAFGTGTCGHGLLSKLEQASGQTGFAQRLEDGDEALLFDAPLTGVEKIDFPWYYFSGGMKVTVGGVRYRIGFDRPANSTVPMHFDESLEDLSRGLESVSEVARARRSGKAWKAVLGDAGQR